MTDVNNLNGHLPENENETPEDMRKAFERFVDHQKKAFDEAGKAVDALLPTGFKEHGNEARREFIKGFKVLVDSAISELEKASREFEKRRDEAGSDAATDGGSPPPPPSTTGRTKVKVQID
jgi:hypothetical protein